MAALVGFGLRKLSTYVDKARVGSLVCPHGLSTYVDKTGARAQAL